MMFKTTYAAMFQNIAPTETLCQQVLSAMQAEEDKKIPTIVPVKRRESHRPVWTLVACAAMVLVAVTLTMALMKDEKPPVLPAVVTTTVTESTTSATTTATVTTAIPTTTVEEEIVPPLTTDTSVTEPSTTVAPTTPSTTPSTTQTQTTTVLNTPPAPTTTTVPSVLPPVEDYDELFQWIESFTTEPPSKDNSFPTASTTTADTTASPTTTTHTDDTDDNPFPESPTTTKPIHADSTSPTTVIKNPPTSTTTSKSDPTTNQSNTTQPYGGVVSYEGEKTTSDTTQSGDRVLGRLQDNAVLLTPLDNAEAPCLSATKPPLGKDVVVKEFGLYGDRMVLLCGSKHTKNTDVTRLFVYDISDPTAPRLLQEFGQSGYYLAAQQADGVLYVASYYVPEGNIRGDDPLSFVPRLYRQGKAALLSPDQIVLANNPVCNGYTVLTAISLKGDPKQTSAIALYGQSNRYVSVYDTSILIRSKPYKDKRGKAVSDLVQVTMDKGTVRFTACTTLPE